MGGDGGRVNLLSLAWAVLVNSSGLIADGYDLMVVDLVIAITTELHPAEMTAERKGFMACMAYAGVISGMLVFGLLAESIGHKLAGIATTLLAALGCAASAACQHSDVVGLALQLGLCRFLLGFGVGGEWPVSMSLGGQKAVGIFREAGVEVSAGQVLMLNIFMFGLGSVLAPAIGALLLSGGWPLDTVWRAVILMGMLPATCTLLARTRMQEVESKAPPAQEGPGSRRVLLCFCLVWALHNLVFFGQGSFRSLMDQRMFTSSEWSGRHRLIHGAVFSLLTALLCQCAYVFLLLTINKLNFFKAQLTCCLSSFLFAALLGYAQFTEASAGVLATFLVLWTLPLSAMGTLSYSSPPLYLGRARSCGIAAAAAKMGACIGTAFFPIVEESYGIVGIMLICSLAALLAAGIFVALAPRTRHDAGLYTECEEEESSSTWSSSSASDPKTGA